MYDPTKGNMSQFMWQGMKRKEQRFFQEALEYHKGNSRKGDKSVYHSVSFLAADPNRKTPCIAPQEFDENFYYNTQLINVRKAESRSAISVPEAYKIAVY